MPIERKMDKLWHIHTVKYYTEIKRRHLIHTKTYINIIDIVFSEKSQTHMYTLNKIPIILSSKTKLINDYKTQNCSHLIEDTV